MVIFAQPYFGPIASRVTCYWFPAVQLTIKFRSPPDPKEDIYKFLLREDEKFNLALIGALPNQGIKQVRIHWLFDLIFSRLVACISDVERTLTSPLIAVIV